MTAARNRRSTAQRGRSGLRTALLAAAALLTALQGARAQTAPGQIDLSEVDWTEVRSEAAGYPGVALFDMPRVYAQSQLVAQLARERQLDAAKRVLDQLLRRYPFIADLHATRALLLAQQNEIEAAISALDRALDLGYPNIGAIRRAKGWSQLTDTMAFRELTVRRRTPPRLPVPQRRPRRVEGQTALVEAENTAWVQEDRALRAAFSFPDTLSRRAAIGHDGRGPVQGLTSRVLRGQGAGLAGVLYDNRDDDHSTLRREDYPRLSFVEYGEEAKARSLHYGLSQGILFDAPTIGNSSTAMTAGAFWRSQPRRALTDPTGPAWLSRLYVGNHLYVYPEHRDHDPVAEGGKGDQFPANTPFFLVSQGSSGSDKEILKALLHILAAMSPETRRSIEARRLLAPTLQMVFRRGMMGIDDETARYMSGAAHPTVFQGDQIDFDRLVAIASRLTPETVPPVAGIQILRDWDTAPGRTVFGAGLSETLFTTPFAIAKVWRSSAMTRRMTLTAVSDGALEPGRVRYEWRILRGDPEKIRLAPAGENGERMSLEIDWHGRTAAERARPAVPEITAPRVDIAVFARYGEEVSAPAILSILFPPLQHRVIDPRRERLESIDYRWVDAPVRYADPLIFPIRDWQDLYGYDPDGTISGWTRVYHDGRRDELYTAQGFLVVESEVSGRPVLVETVSYPTTRLPSGPARVDVVRSGERFRVIYENDEVRRGVMVRELPDEDAAAQ